jgi:hypothetical protein
MHLAEQDQARVVERSLRRSTCRGLRRQVQVRDDELGRRMEQVIDRGNAGHRVSVTRCPSPRPSIPSSLPVASADAV